MTNPLLKSWSLPPFSAIQPEHMEPAIKQLIEENLDTIEERLAATQDYTWNNLIQPIEEKGEHLSRAWSPIGHLNAVKNSQQVREAFNSCLPILSEYSTKLGQHAGLYNAYKHIHQSAGFADLDTAQKKVITNALRDFELSGIGLPEDKQQRYGEIRAKLSELTAKFDANVLDATNAWSKHITDATELEGLPESALAAAKQTAQALEKDGYVLTLQFPCYFAVITYANNRALRQEVYTAFSTRASDQGPHANQWDNHDLMADILALRHELAVLLGFTNYTEYSLATKMAESPAQVFDFLRHLAVQAKPQAAIEYTRLREFAQELDGLEDFQAWDAPYYGEKLKQKLHQVSQEELRPYFPEDKVLSGLFTVVNKLYGITIEEKTEQAETWHPSVRYFEIRRTTGELAGSFYLDLYARQDKRGGAWMDECKVRCEFSDGHINEPVAYLTCNFNGPVGDTPALFTHDEVETLFHEFGHGLHHMLTRINYPDISGINGVAWDAVELPSQFLENWCWQKESLTLISGHYQSGEPIPDALFDKLNNARNFQSSMQLCRQLEFALFDFELHSKDNQHTKPDIQGCLDTVRQEVAVSIPPKFNRFQNSFSHIFAGGYAAGYYSYLWAEVLSSDAFSRFEEEGIFNTQAGNDFLTCILEKGGSEEPMELFKAFRGREPSVEPLLRHRGIKAA